MTKKALIAMSGGVDSSVAAQLMLNAGFDCVGVTMKLFGEEDTNQGIEDARKVAQRVGIPFHVADCSPAFRQEVICRFISAYENGCTPNPCVDCNKHLKFGQLFDVAHSLGCDYVATGHYARIEQDAKTGRYLLRKAVDLSKDQSYMLYSLSQEQLAHAVFPLGTINNKEQVRNIATDQGFDNAQKHDSQDICFIPDGDYAAYIERATGKKFKAGNFIDEHGNVLGRHRGIIHYTVGQRKGLGLALPQPMYVKEIDPATNNVILTTNDGLFTTKVIAKSINLIDCDKIEGQRRVKARIRYKQQEQWATVTQPDADTLELIFDEPQRAITKGQSLVMYDGEYVIGGGKIV